MSPPSQRRGVLTLHTVGRAFWIGLAASLALHAFFIAKGNFPKAQLDASPPLEARLEAGEFDAVPLPPPETVSEPPPPAQPAPQSLPPPQQAAPVLAPFPDLPIIPLEDPPAPPASAPRQALPLSTAEPPPPSAQPHALLTQAAERIRNLPAQVEIVYELKGMLSGRQTHTWQRTGDRYNLEAVAQATGLTSLFIGGKLIQKSSGRIGSLGLMPDRYEILRPNGKNETLEFHYDDNLIEASRSDSKRGTRTQQLPMLPGTQDPLSSIYQLAMAARDGKDGIIVAASSKKVQGFPYRMLGSETLKTPMGEIKTLHVMRAGESGKGDTHLWLALEKHALPMRVRYADDDGTEWLLDAVSIVER